MKNESLRHICSQSINRVQSGAQLYSALLWIMSLPSAKKKLSDLTSHGAAEISAFSSSLSAGRSYTNSQELVLLGITNPNLKEQSRITLPLKQCLSTISRFQIGVSPMLKFIVSPTVCRYRKSGPKWYLIILFVGSSSSLSYSLSISSSGTSTSVMFEIMSLILNPLNLNLAQLSESLQRNLSVGPVRVLTYSGLTDYYAVSTIFN